MENRTSKDVEVIQVLEDAAEGERLYWLNMAKRAQESLLEVLSDPDAPHAAIVSASKEIFDRAYGKPKESIDVTTKGRPLFMRRDEVEESVDNLLATS